MEDKTLYLFITKPPKGKANRYIRQKNGAVFKPWLVTSWEALAMWEIQNQLKESEVKTPFSCNVSVDIVIFLPDKRRRDIDNMLKTLWDTLEKADVIENDNLIHEVHTIKHIEKGLDGIFLAIKPYEEGNHIKTIEDIKKRFIKADNNIIAKGG